MQKITDTCQPRQDILTGGYFDVATQRMIAVGKHDDRIVIIPYETAGDTIVPVTVHATTRQQIKFRLKTGRFEHEKT